MSEKPKLRVVLCSPRGFCAGVTRAIDVVETALKLHGAPVYVRHEIVHNKYVVDSLKAKGAIFVKELDEAPAGAAPVIFSAHGVPKSVPAEAERPRPQRDRRHLPAGHQGASRGAGAFQARPPHHPDRPRRPSRSRRHARPTCRRARSRWSANRAEVEALEVAGGQGTRLCHPDDALGRRHARRDRGAESEVPADPGAAGRGHLLRHHQPPGGGEGGGASGRRGDRRRRGQFLQFAAPARGRRARGLRDVAAGAERRRARFRPARRRALGGDHRRRVGARKSSSSRSSTASPSVTRWRSRR